MFLGIAEHPQISFTFKYLHMMLQENIRLSPCLELHLKLKG